MKNRLALGKRLRYFLGISDEQTPDSSKVRQHLTVIFPADTISGIARYETVPKIK